MKAAATKIQTAVRRYLGSERRLKFRVELDLFRQERPQRMRKYSAIDRGHIAWSGYKGLQSFQLMKTAAVKLQAAYRCCLQRQRFVCLKAAALKVQTAVRGHTLWQQFLTSRTAAIVVQRLLRVRVCRQGLRRFISAAVTALQASNSWFSCKHAHKCCISGIHSYIAIERPTNSGTHDIGRHDAHTC